MPKAEILLEGNYNYYSGQNSYCQENFKLVRNLEQGSFQIHAEVLSRIESGELLKILVKYEMNQAFLPVMARIERSLGPHYSHELFTVDLSTHELHYTFENSGQSQEFKAPFNIKHYLSTPALSTSCLFLQSKKLDATSRTPVTFVSSSNVWKYEAPPFERVIFAESLVHEGSEIEIGGKALNATQVQFYEESASNPQVDVPAQFFISKHFSIPYQMIQGDLRIEIEQLKKLY
jgi:hypothetical protein